MGKAGRFAAIVAAGCLIAACAKPRVVIVPPGEPVQLREPVKAKVWVGAEMKEATVVIPAGWWALPDPDDQVSPPAR